MKSHRLLSAAAVLALAAAPAALAKKGGDNPGKGHGPKARNVVAKGIVKSNDGTTLVVTVPAPKGKGKGQANKPSGDVTFTLSPTTKLTVADSNGDGVTAADILVGDKVVVQAKGDVVRHVVDQTHPPVGDDDDDAAETDDDAPAPAPTA